MCKSRGQSPADPTAGMGCRTCQGRGHVLLGQTVTSRESVGFRTERQTRVTCSLQIKSSTWQSEGSRSVSDLHFLGKGREEAQRGGHSTFGTELGSCLKQQPGFQVPESSFCSATVWRSPEPDESWVSLLSTSCSPAGMSSWSLSP